MSNNSIKKKTLTNLFWSFAERCGAQGVAFIVSIILARLLTPEDYGIIALVTVFITIFQVFVDSGLGNALIQKKDVDDVDFSSVFYFNIIFCLVLYGLLFLSAPWIAKFYNISELTSVIRVLGLSIVISGVKNVQHAYVSRTLQFKRFFWATLGGTIGAAIIGITMAYNGFGVWALVAQNIFNLAVDTIILWFTVKWRPKLLFSFKRLKKLFSYGWKLLASSLINTLYNDIRQLIIGKFYSSADLAFYNKGRQFPKQFITNINTSIDSVLFPVLSEGQDDKNHLKSMTRRSIQISSYIIWPIMIGLAAVGQSLIRVLFTDKWLPSYPFLVLFCISLGLQPIHTANLNAIKAVGRSDLFLKLEIIKKSIGILIVLLTMRISVLAMAVGVLAYNIIVSVINSFPNRKLLNYSYFEQMKDIFPSVSLSFAMGICVYFISNLLLNDFLLITIQVVVGALIYIAGSVLFRLDSFFYIKDILFKFFKRK